MYSYQTFWVIVAGTDYAEETACEGFLRHKRFSCSPAWLTSRGVDVYRIVQYPGQYVIVKPGVLHWGFNAGDNVAEATNFACADHYKEIQEIPGQYKFVVCKSGLRRGRDDFRDDGHHCAIGHSAGVAELRQDDVIELMPDLSQKKGRGKSKTPKCGKSSKHHFVREKRKGEHHPKDPRPPSPKRRKGKTGASA